MIIRDARVDDMEAVCAIYNALIPTTTIAWTESLQTLEQRLAWFAEQQRRARPTLVAEIGGMVVGFTAYGDFRGYGIWPGYRHTAEHTVHVDRSAWGRGAGRALVEALLDRARQDDIHVMVAAIDGGNVESIRFHERVGFDVVARMPEVGNKFGRWCDLVLMQRILGDTLPAVSA